MADTGTAKAASAAGAPWSRFTDLNRSRFFAHVQASRERLLNHPGHTPQKVHGGQGGGGGDDDDEFVGEVDEGDYGFGRDPNGKSYTELDVDQETGEPKFSQAYRDKYGNVQADQQIGESPYRLVDTEKGIHIADDSGGPKQRAVVQELTRRQAGSLGDDVYAVNTGEAGRTNRATGVRVEPDGGPNAEGYVGTTVTFSNGGSVSLSPDETFDFQESLDMSSQPGPSNRLSILVNRTRLLNHPGHSSQKSHGRKGTPAPDGVGSGKLGPKASKLDRVEDPGDIRAQAMGANPGYLGPYSGPMTPEVAAAGGATYTYNCTRVAIAYELRRRGLDVTAGAATVAGDSTAAYLRTFRAGDKYAVRVEQDLGRNMTSREIVAEVEAWPLGARGIVTISGHTLNVERDAKTGKAVFVDSQAAKKKNPVMDHAAFQRRVKSRGAPDRHMAVARVDDLDVSDYGLHYVESSGLDIAAGHVLKTRYPDTPDMTFPSDEDLLSMTPDDTYP